MKKLAKISLLVFAFVAMVVAMPTASAKVLSIDDIQGITKDSDGLYSDVFIFARCALVDSYTAKDIAECVSTIDITQPLDTNVYKLTFDETANKTVVTNRYYEEKTVDQTKLFDVSEMHTSVAALEEAEDNVSEGAETYGEIETNTDTLTGVAVISFKESYTLTFYKYELGSEVNEVLTTLKVEEDGKYPELPTLTKDNYYFIGWSSYESDGGMGSSIQIIAGEDVVNKSLDVYPDFLGVEKVVTLNVNGGELPEYTEEETTYNYGFIFRNPYPTKEGYTFAGWYDGETLYSNDTEITKDVTLTAKWTANDVNYYVTHKYQNLDKETYTDVVVSATGKTGELTEATAVEEEGFLLNSTITQKTIAADGSTNVEIFYVRKGYTVEYQPNNGGLNRNFESTVFYEDVYANGSNLSKLNDLTNPGYTLTGWKNGETLVSENDIVTSNVVLTAVWTPNEYTITFNTDGGSDVDAITLPYGSEVTAPANPTRDGYTFAGWDAEVPATMPIDGAELTAQWTVNNYTLKFMDGETVLNDVTSVAYGTEIIAPDTTKDGYTFAGWSAEVPGTMPANDVTLYGTWNPVNYAITYVLDGGSVANANPTSYTIEDEFTLTNPTKEGYDFAGWTISGNPASEKIMELTVSNETGDKTFTANWIPTLYTIEYELDGGSVTENRGTYTIADTFTLTNPTKAGYTFAGWIGTEITGSATTVTVDHKTGNRSYTATWTVNTHTLTFKDGDEVLSTASVAYGTELSYPSTIKEGYTFVAWDKNNTTMPDEDLTITGTWSVNNYNLTFKDGDEVLNTTSVAYGAATPTIADPEKVGYTFTGWNEEVPATMPASDVTINATWSVNNYNLTFKDGNQVLNTASVAYGATTTTIADPEKVGYTFTGWDAEVPATMPASDVTINATWSVNNYNLTFKDGDEVLNTASVAYGAATPTIADPEKVGYTFTGWDEEVPATMPASDVTINATWQINTHTLSFQTEGVVAPSDLTVTIGTDYDLTTGDYVLARNGYVFEGWYTAKNGGDKVTTFTPTIETEDTTLYAHWREVTFTLVHKQQNITRNAYVEESSATIAVKDLAAGVTPKEDGSFDVNLETAGLVNDYEGFSVVGPLTEVNVSTDNETVATINYDRQVVRVTFSPNRFRGSQARLPYGYEVKAGDFPSVTGTLLDGEAAYNVVWTYNDEELDLETAGTTLFTVGTSNITVRGTVTPIDYTITYNLNGGTNGANPATYNADTAKTNLVDPNRANYGFQGWYTTETFDAGTRVVSIKGGESLLTETTESSGVYDLQGHANVELFAKWGPENYAITYEGLTAEEITALANPAGYNVESVFTLTNPERLGYTFDGWTIGTSTEKLATVTSATLIEAPGAKTITANWTKISYSLTYSLANGNVASANPDEYYVDTETFTLNKPAKEGYTFAGWTGTGLDAATQEVTIPVGSTGNKSYTATYTPVIYDIHYELNGGTVSGSNATYYTIESADITLINPTKEGYTFAGWTGTGLDSATAEVTIAHGSTGERTYTATWTPIEYTITYAGLEAGDTNSNTVTKYTIETPTITFVAPERTGYTGIWDTTSIPNGSTGNKTITASWTADEYTITYELNGGANPTSNPTTFTIESADITLAAPTKEGYTGTWNVDTIAHGTHTNVTVTASYETIDYTMGYELNGGTVSGNPTEYNIESDDITLINPTKAGYKFAGWTGTGLNSATAEVTVANGSTGNRTYTATWTPIEYTITYAGLEEGDTNSNTVTKYTIETPTITFVAPERTGYTGIWDTTSIPLGSTGNKTITANWTINTYTITYMGLGDLGTNPAGNPTSYKVTDATITLLPPTRDGFTGVWDTTSIPTGSTGNKTITASWTENTYTVTYVNNNGSDDTVVNRKYTDSSITLPTVETGAPTKVGYTFVGWYDNAELTGEPVTTVAQYTTVNKTFYAKYTENVYTVTYVKNNEEAEEVVNRNYTVALDLPSGVAAPTKAGHTFAGWYDNEGLIGEAVTTVAANTAENKTFYAKYTVNTHTLKFMDGETPISSTEVAYGTAITVPTPNKDGYTLTGWGATVPATMPDDDLIFTAVWTANTYNVTLLSFYDGVQHSDSKVKEVTYKQTYGELNPEDLGITFDDGYVFAGWYSDEDCTDGNEVTAESIVNIAADHDLYAKLTLTSYDITYHLANGENVAANPATYTIETDDIELADPTRDGYEFAGWYSDVNYTNEVESIPYGSTGNKVVYAKWDATDATKTAQAAAVGTKVTTLKDTYLNKFHDHDVIGLVGDSFTLSESWHIQYSLQLNSAYYVDLGAVEASVDTISINGTSYAFGRKFVSIGMNAWLNAPNWVIRDGHLYVATFLLVDSALPGTTTTIIAGNSVFTYEVFPTETDAALTIADFGVISGSGSLVYNETTNTYTYYTTNWITDAGVQKTPDMIGFTLASGETSYNYENTQYVFRVMNGSYGFTAPEATDKFGDVFASYTLTYMAESQSSLKLAIPGKGIVTFNVNVVNGTAPTE